MRHDAPVAPPTVSPLSPTPRLTAPWVGRRIRRFEDPALLRGEGEFVADLDRGAAHLRFVRSPVASGTIVSIDVPPGATVFTGEDLSGIPPLLPLLHRPDYIPLSQPLLPRDRVSYVGQPVAVVVAESESAAEDLAEEVFVDIDPTPPVIGFEAALSPGARAVHSEVPGNVILDSSFQTDGFDAVFDDAPHHVAVEVRTRGENAMPLEARGAHAEYDRRSGRVTLTTSTQGPHMDRTAIMELLGLGETDLQVRAADVGGAFGQKYSLAVEDVITVWCARRLRRSVAWTEDRRENFFSFHSRESVFSLVGAFDGSARLISLRADILCDVGAFSCYPVTCGVEPLMALAEMTGPYDVRHYSGRARAILTNTTPMAPYRGVARPVVILALERLMDTAAARLDTDPVEIRKRNLVVEFPYRTATGIVYDEGSYVESLSLAAEMIDIDRFRQTQREARKEGRYLGLGISTFCERTGYGTPAFAVRNMDIVLGFETVQLTMGTSGQVEARIGASPHGQGLRTSLAQLIADELGLTPDQVDIVHGDTDRTPFGWGTFASRSMVIAGGACRMAAGELREKLAAIAADRLEASAEDLVFLDGEVRVRGTDVGTPVRDVARIAYLQSHRLGPGEAPGLSVTATYDPEGTFSNACHVAVVEVDAETGKVGVERFLVVEDAGLLINPMIADGQVHGGVTQGIGAALLEELVYDGDGNLLTTSLVDYLPPTMADIPQIEIEHLETLSDATLTRAKGLGEGGTIGAPAAVLNAVNDALSPLGARLDTIPATPERVRAAIRAAGQ